MYKESRQVRNAGFALLAGYHCATQWQELRNATSSCIDWDDPKDPNSRGVDGPVGDFRIPEKFLISKQLFVEEGESPIPSFPPKRGRSRRDCTLDVRVGGGDKLTLPFTVVLSYFETQNVLTLVAYVRFSEISIDRLLFVKEAKWFKEKDEDWLRLRADGSNPQRVDSYADAFEAFLHACGANGFCTKDWPLFDFLEISDYGPALGGGPNSDVRLTVREHYGLLYGDEGYRLIDDTEKRYQAFLLDDDTRFRGRAEWLYNFGHTTCLSFVTPDIAQSRLTWSTYYRDRVGYVPILDRYIGFDTDVPSLRDGIPLLVELCLLRYVELRAIADLLKKEQGSSIWQIFLWMWMRFRGTTPIERAVSALQRLDLYQDTALWIIGGAYTDLFYAYGSIRKGLDRAIATDQSVSSDVRVFIIGIISLVLAILALVLKK